MVKHIEALGLSIHMLILSVPSFLCLSDNLAFQGAGLGLSVAKAYVELLGAKIWLQSGEPEGITFYFTIPLRTVKVQKTVV